HRLARQQRGVDTIRLLARITRCERDGDHLPAHRREIERAAVAIQALDRDQLRDQRRHQQRHDRMPSKWRSIEWVVRSAGMRAVAATVLIVSVASAKEKLPRFQPVEAAPYFASGPAQAAAAELRLEEWAKAAKDFADYLK